MRLSTCQTQARTRRIGISRRDDRGAVAVVVAASLTMLLISVALVLDFGLVRLDRQQVRKLTDNAVMAGLVESDNGTGDVYSYRAVCGALSYLRSSTALSGLPESFCAPPSLAGFTKVVCDADVPGTHVSYDHTVSSGGVTYRVVIRSPYVLASTWREETLATRVTDGSEYDGCDQLGVEVYHARKPGLGSLATSGDLTFALRSVARAIIAGDDTLSPSLLILERTNCSVLTVGAAGGGTGTFINVNGAGASPGSIHVDSNGTGPGCGGGSNQQIMQGKQNDGIVAYGSTSPTGSPGLISSVAKFNGIADNVIGDDPNKVYGTTSVSGTGVDKIPARGRPLIGRKPVDRRYRTAVRNAIFGANPVWGNTAGWTVSGCNPGPAQLAAAKLYIDCPRNAGITLNNTTISSSEIYFNGFIKGGLLSMPNATRVYVSNTIMTSGGYVNDAAGISADAITLSNNTGFCVRATCGTTAAAACPTTSATGRARVLVRNGTINASGGVLRLCNTTVVMLGGRKSDGCVPPTDNLPPTTTPCAGSAVPSGTGTISVSGGGVFDWTAPNLYVGAIPDADRATAWGDFEDLALWSETSGTYAFSGGGGMKTRGVYMIPNGSPVTVGGGSAQNLVNAQYVARTFSVNGGGTLSITTDANNAVSVPTVRAYILIR
jgi:hypothetical protein